MNARLPIRTSDVLFPLTAVVLLAWTIQAGAETMEEKGFAVAARSDRSDVGFGDSHVQQLRMVLRGANREETTRSLSIKTLEKVNEDVGDKSLIVFDAPADINGTALLSHAQILEPDNQWLLLPALKRTKRISSVNKSGPFVGSEFAFEDLTSLELNKFTYKYLRSEACGELKCDIVERRPRYQHSGYTRQIVWIDQNVYQVRRIEYYDRRDELLKVLTFDDYRQYLNKYWRPHRLSMVNQKTNKSTDLLYSTYVFKSGLTKADFETDALRRVR